MSEATLTATCPPPAVEVECCTITSFFRYPHLTTALELHMARHVSDGWGDYLCLSVGASEGREAISAAISWYDVQQSLGITAPARIQILGLEPQMKEIDRFSANRFGIVKGLDNEEIRLRRYAEVIDEPEVLYPNLPKHLRPGPVMSFPARIIESVTMIHSRLEDVDLETLLFKASGRTSGFDAVICHTAARYMQSAEVARAKLQAALREGGFLSFYE